MKRLTAIFLLIINCFLLTGCNKTYKSALSTISEIRYNIFAGCSDHFDVTFMSGRREKDYVINGYNTELIDFGIVTISVKDPDAQINNPRFSLTINTLRYDDILEKNPFDGTYVADIKNIIDDDLNSITLKLFMGDIVEELTLQNLSINWKVDSKKALKIACKELSKELAPLITNMFLGETYIKIIKDTIINNDSYYWYVNFASRNGIYHSIIIDPMTSEILAKK